MPTKPKYDYDLKKIAELESDGPNGRGLSIRAAAKKLGLCEVLTQAWVNRRRENEVYRVVRYEKRKK